jgi:hypothetical protein
MVPDVAMATYQGEYRIELEFEDGKKGVVDFSRYLKRGGVFERFKDPEFFRSFSVNPEFGTLVWGDEIDIAPEILYAEATGTGFPPWMDPEGPSTANERLHPDSARTRGG